MSSASLPRIASRPATRVKFWTAVAGRLTWRFALGTLVLGAAVWLVMTTNWPNRHANATHMWLNWGIAICLLSVPIGIAILIADEAVERGRSRVSTYIIAVAAAATVGAIGRTLVMYYATDLPFWFRDERWEIAVAIQVYVTLLTLLFAGLATFVYVGLRSSTAAARARNAAALARVEAKRWTLESQLLAMQARVEPQFLFNTLAQVRALYERDPALAGRMLDDLITYLRAALPQLREPSSTLDREAALARAYLGILQVGLGERLSFSFDIPDALRDARMPPMLLLPLVEDALARCGAPSASARLAVSAVAAGNRLRVTVAMNGGGFDADNRAAPLASIAERVAALYADRGAFRIEPIPEGGARAVLEVPHENADVDHR